MKIAIVVFATAVTIGLATGYVLVMLQLFE
jgi:hypothetical protein